MSTSLSRFVAPRLQLSPSFKPSRKKANPKPQPLRVSCKSTFSSNDAERREIFKENTPGVVLLFSKAPPVGYDFAVFKKPPVDGYSISLSSGFLVTEEGLVITCFHNVSKRINAESDDGSCWVETCANPNVQISFFDRSLGNVKAEVITLVPDLDIAVLKAPSLPQSLKSHVVSFSKSPPQVGDSIFIIGHPDVEYACRSGYVSSPVRHPQHFNHDVFARHFKNKIPGFHLSELDVRSDEGCSGGPVLNGAGEVIGMIIGIIGRRQGSALAVPSKFLQAVLHYSLNREKDDPVIVGGERFVTEDDVREAVELEKKPRLALETQTENPKHEAEVSK